MRRILFVDPVGEKGGAQVVLRDIVCGLDRTSYEPLVVCLKPGPFVEELRDAGITTFALRAHKTREVHQVIAAIWQIAKMIRREKIDLVHANGGSMLLYAGTASWLSHRPCVWQVYDPLDGRTTFEKAFVHAQRRLRPVWTIFGTPAVSESYLSAYLNIRRHSTILPGVDVDQVTLEADPRRARQDWNIPENVPLITMFARMQRTKGHRHLIRAAELLKSDYPQAHFILCGGTLFGLEPSYPDELREMIQESGLGDQFRLPGFITDQQKRDLLAATTIVAHTADSEPFGLAVTEGMAAAKPIVATDCIGPAITVEDEKTGLLTSRGDVKALAEAIKSLLDNPARAQAMGKRGKLRVNELFSVEAMLKQIEAVYAEIA